jgi:hypothetical protein
VHSINEYLCEYNLCIKEEEEEEETWELELPYGLCIIAILLRHQLGYHWI